MDAKERNIFVGVAWPYVNGDLHIGHLAGYLLPADIVARFHRLRGNKVLMASGSDCHGTPITVEADKRGISPEALVQEYHPKVKKLFQDLELSFDIYTHTLTKNHHAVTQEIFLTLLKNGYIFKDNSVQYFSVQENRFLPDRYVEGTCPHCGFGQARSDQCDNCGSPLAGGDLINPLSKNTQTAVELRPTEHYFLDWPKLQPFLEEYVEAHKTEWRPWVVSETKKWLKEGLKPRAITRDLNWGIEIPADRVPRELLVDNYDQKRIYVWFEAVIGYYSASLEWASENKDRSWKEFWENPKAKHYYYMGKDNLVFHTLFWPGQLHGFNPALHLPDQPAINHFLTFEGKKFSKSRGVFVDPRELVDKYGLAAVRFYVSFLAPETSDADFTYESLTSVTNSILVGKIGNFVHRSLTLAKDLDFSSETNLNPEVIAEVERLCAVAREALEQSEIRRYVTAVIDLAEYANKYISVKAPWDLKRQASPNYDLTKFKSVMSDCLYMTLALGLTLKPLLPGTAAVLDQTLGVSLSHWPETVSNSLALKIKSLKISEPKPLFSRIETALK